MGQERDKNESLLERYKEDEASNVDSSQWSQLLDLRSPIETESDWFSTKTFQMFLDALDINQITSINDKNNIKKFGESIEKDNCLDLTGKVKDEKTDDNDKSLKVETILSAEALKILSELPDLSHMSATKSFIFHKEKRFTGR